MRCELCGSKPLIVWNDSDRYDYICPGQHGPLGDVAFYNEVWDGSRYVLTLVRPPPSEVETWKVAESAKSE